MVASQASPNALPADQLTPPERIAEVGKILALGLMRLEAPKSSSLSADRGDSFVDFVPDQSGHADAPELRMA
jgi:hypothetical protein